MEENFDITNILVSDRFKEASREAYKRFPRYKSQVTYEGVLQGEIPCDYFPQQVIIKRHFYVDGEEVSKDEYEDVVKLTAYCLEARKIVLDEAKLEIIRNRDVISAHPGPIPEDPNLISEVSRFLKDTKESNEKRMEYFDYIIEVLKHGPKSSRELEKRICKSRKVCGHSAYFLLDKLEYYDIVYKQREAESGGLMHRLMSFIHKRHEAESVKIMYRLTPFGEIMHSSMKK